MASEIFHIEEDTSLRVHLHQDCVDNAAKVIERIKTNGGSICTQARYADVILVNPDQGGDVAAEWRHKPVLDPRWVHRCIKAGRALMEDDDWAGCRVPPNDVPSSSPPQVPTPRITPDQHGPRQASPTSAIASTSGNMMHYNPAQFGSPNMAPMGAPNAQMMPYMNVGFPYYTPADPTFYATLQDVVAFGPNAGPGRFGDPAFATASAPAFPFNHTPTDDNARSASADSHHISVPYGHAADTTHDAAQDVSKILSGTFLYVQLTLSKRTDLLRDIKTMGGRVANNVETADYVVLSKKTKYYERPLKDAQAHQRTVVDVSFVKDCLRKGRLLPVANYILKSDELDSDEDSDASMEGDDDDDDDDDERPRAKKRKSETLMEELVRKRSKVAKPVPKAAKPATVSKGKASAANSAVKSVASSSKVRLDSDPTILARSAKTQTKKEDVKPSSPMVEPPSTSKTQAPSPKPAKLPKVTLKVAKVEPPKKGRPVKSSSCLYDRADRSPSPTPPAKSTWQLLGKTGDKYKYTALEIEYAEQYIVHLKKYDPAMTRTLMYEKVSAKMPNHTPAAWMQSLSHKFGDVLARAEKRGGVENRNMLRAAAASSAPASAELKSKGAARSDVPKEQPASLQAVVAAPQPVRPAHAPELVPPPTPPPAPVPDAASQTAQQAGPAPAPELVPTSALPPAPVPDAAPQATQQDWEDDMSVIVRFFAYEGGDSGAAPEVVWPLLENKIKSKTAPSWEQFFEQHGEEVVNRYKELTGQKEQAPETDT
ncbi:hypothetical protein BD626DRAFT_137117 [Schizophyllum amplum]|uniref:BRCT domain-containing protein n=1 Tax=Schizophyllum amplum TaxID=97359 RepID=A0A550C5Y9_9AGAR|nr:hypothetical protein BD626DRAFT_137117 [Auriculariopsis ampla]